MGGHYHNGVEENPINNVVIISRTMIIHSILRWPVSSEKSLWLMDIAYAVHLKNYTTQISSGMSPEEVWTRYKHSYIDLHNAHSWG